MYIICHNSEVFYTVEMISCLVTFMQLYCYKGEVAITRKMYRAANCTGLSHPAAVLHWFLESN